MRHVSSAEPLKTKRKQPFVLKSFLHADEGRAKAKYQKNEIIFRQGDLADAVFYIMEGECKVTVVSEKGEEAVVALHEKGDFFGEGCLNGHPRRLATVTAITASKIMRLDKATMVRALHGEPKFSELFISHLLARNVRVEADLVDQLFNSSEKRLVYGVRGDKRSTANWSRNHLPPSVMPICSSVDCIKPRAFSLSSALRTVCPLGDSEVV